MRTRLALLIVLAATPAFALEYTCPADPGFCYRDVGDDGCFDSGVDEGPIDAEIVASATLPPAPPPGSIVCPPSVTLLNATAGSIRLATPEGSSILIYAARINVASSLELVSGEAIFVEGRVFATEEVVLSGAGEVELAADVSLHPSGSPRDLLVESETGDVVVGPKSKLIVGSAEILAPAGDVVILRKSSLKSRNGAESLTLAAGGRVDLDEAAFDVADGSAALRIEGSEVVSRGKTKIKSFVAGGVEIVATAGDVSLERISITQEWNTTISGTNVWIGLPVAGKVPRSKITNLGSPVRIEAIDTIEIVNLLFAWRWTARFETEGQTINVFDSHLKGIVIQAPLFVRAGSGSTCDFTGSTSRDVNIFTTCDTVIY